MHQCSHSLQPSQAAHGDTTLSSAADLGVNVNQSKSNPKEYTTAALQEEDVPHPQAALQGQAVHKNAKEPVGADTGDIHPVAFQMTAEAGKAIVHQLLEDKLVNLYLQIRLTQGLLSQAQMQQN